MRRLLYGYLRDGYRDVGVFSVSHYAFSNLMRRMAYRGAWRPALEFLAEAVAAQTGIRDYLDGEKVVHAFLAAHFSLTGQHFVIHSERELNKGHADLHLEPFLARYPDVRYGYVLEIKYLKRGSAADESAVAARLRAARAQLRRYLADESLRRQPVRYVGVAVVFHGWEMVACEAEEDDAEGGAPASRRHERWPQAWPDLARGARPVAPTRGPEARGAPAPPAPARFLRRTQSTGFQTRPNPKPLKSFTLAVAKSVTPCRRSESARRASQIRRRPKAGSAIRGQSSSCSAMLSGSKPSSIHRGWRR